MFVLAPKVLMSALEWRRPPHGPATPAPGTEAAQAAGAGSFH